MKKDSLKEKEKEENDNCEKDSKSTTAEEYVKDQEQFIEKIKKLRDDDPFIYD